MRDKEVLERPASGTPYNICDYCGGRVSVQSGACATCYKSMFTRKR